MCCGLVFTGSHDMEESGIGVPVILLHPTEGGSFVAPCSGPRPVARRWPSTLYDAYPTADGLWYGSSMHANAPCLALFERVASSISSRPAVHRALADATLRAFLENSA